MTVLITGDRNWQNDLTIRRAIESLPPGTTIVHGGARGADTIAGFIAVQLGFAVCVHRADWEHYGRAAGPIRNSEMLKEHKIDRVLAFHPNLAQSKGTKDMINKALKQGVPVTIFSD